MTIKNLASHQVFPQLQVDELVFSKLIAQDSSSRATRWVAPTNHNCLDGDSHVGSLIVQHEKCSFDADRFSQCEVLGLAFTLTQPNTQPPITAFTHCCREII